jgi:ABC-type glycerol-3-phosphate transport system substrate-binding protein
MNLTIARSIPSTKKLLTPTYTVLSIGLAITLGAALISQTSASLSSSSGKAVPSAWTSPPLGQPAKQPVTLYIVESQAEADALNSTVAKEGLAGPVNVLVASEPGAQEQLALLVSQDVPGLLWYTRMVDTRSR